MTLSFISKNEYTIEQNVALFETVCNKNNWPYLPEELHINYLPAYPNGRCDFSIWTSSLIKYDLIGDVLLVGTIKNEKEEPFENLIDQDYPYYNFHFELLYEDESNWFSNKGLIFTYQFMKELLAYKPDWVFLDHDIAFLYTIYNIDDFAKKYEFSTDAFSFDFTNPPQ